jgi:hypothetical protein
MEASHMTKGRRELF